LFAHEHNKRQSLPERLVADALRAFPALDVRREVRIGKYRVDVLIGRLVIEIQGTTWHSRPEDVERDARRAACLHRYGYEVAYITEQEILNLSPLGLIDHLDSLLRRHEHCVWVHAPRT
jgi:very-short-patch-repair endonuclease